FWSVELRMMRDVAGFTSAPTTCEVLIPPTPHTPLSWLPKASGGAQSTLRSRLKTSVIAASQLVLACSTSLVAHAWFCAFCAALAPGQLFTLVQLGVNVMLIITARAGTTATADAIKAVA